jgi:hypothetical protein
MGWTVATRNEHLEDEYSVTRYVGASLADPGPTGSAVSEPVGGSYARVAIEPADWAAASGGVKVSAVDVTFPAPTGDWGLLTHGVIFDAAEGGNVRGSAALPTPLNVASGGTAPVIPAGKIAVTLT